MAHLTPAKNCSEATNSRKQIKMFNPNIPIQKKCVLMARLKDDKSVMFHSRGPARKKALSFGSDARDVVFGRHC